MFFLVLTFLLPPLSGRSFLLVPKTILHNHVVQLKEEFLKTNSQFQWQCRCDLNCRTHIFFSTPQNLIYWIVFSFYSLDLSFCILLLVQIFLQRAKVQFSSPRSHSFADYWLRSGYDIMASLSVNVIIMTINANGLLRSKNMRFSRPFHQSWSKIRYPSCNTNKTKW